jgi:flagellar assembly protein FliH
VTVRGTAKTLSEGAVIAGAVSYDFEQLEPSEPPPRDAATRLIAQAEAEAEQIRAQAHQQGFAAGRVEGLAAMAVSGQALGEALQGVQDLRLGVAEAIEGDAVELALALAGKILSGALQARPELVVEAVQGALRRVSDRRQITVLLNPEDLDAVKEAIGELQAQVNGIELCDLQSDQRVERGGAIVRTVEGELDASVTTQLERAREVVSAALEQGEQAL